jgi:hypothetical protein
MTTTSEQTAKSCIEQGVRQEVRKVTDRTVVTVATVQRRDADLLLYVGPEIDQSSPWLAMVSGSAISLNRDQARHLANTLLLAADA